MTSGDSGQNEALGSQPGQRAMGSQLGLPGKSQREGGGILGSVRSILHAEPRGREREASPGGLGWDPFLKSGSGREMKDDLARTTASARG